MDYVTLSWDRQQTIGIWWWGWSFPCLCSFHSSAAAGARASFLWQKVKSLWEAVNCISECKFHIFSTSFFLFKTLKKRRSGRYVKERFLVTEAKSVLFLWPMFWCGSWSIDQTIWESKLEVTGDEHLEGG